MDLKKFWNERFGHDDWTYGKEPNGFFKNQINSLRPGKLLLPAEGEGRNAAYAASVGWKVDAFDVSEQGKKKAEILAKEISVTFNYKVAEFKDISFDENTFDLIALIYAHFQPETRAEYHKKLVRWLKPGGKFILEGFGKDQLKIKEKNSEVGGPGNIDMLYSIEELQKDFEDLSIIQLEEKLVNLNEGRHHKGKSALIRFIGQKE